MKKLVYRNTLVLFLVLFGVFAFFSGTHALAANIAILEKEQFLEEIEAVKARNEELLATAPMQQNAMSATNFKAAVTFSNTLSISEAETIIEENEIPAHAVYLRFVEPDGTIGTGYQLLKDNNEIDTTYIEMTEDQGIDFVGVISMEALVTPQQYQALSSEEKVYIVNLGEADESYPEDYFWNLEKFSLTK